MITRRLIFAFGIAGLLACAAASPAYAADPAAQSAVSANWSGYVAGSGADGTSRRFSSVSGSWVEPSVDCSWGSGSASFWVGLGGAGQESGSLEQVGTGTDCGASGDVSHYAWYELVPAAPVRLPLSVSPGDHLSGRVTVNGTNVTVSLTNQTTGGSQTKTLRMDDPDVSSAEWIAEAPSACDSSGCQPVPLADFGTVNFANATATADGHTGTISDQSWTAQPVTLSSAGGYGPAEVVDAGSADGAEPSTLSTDGSSFAVGYAAADVSTATSSGGYPVDPYGGAGDPGADAGGASTYLVW